MLRKILLFSCSLCCASALHGASNVDNLSLLKSVKTQKAQKIDPVAPPRINKISVNTGGRDIKQLNNAQDYLNLHKKRDKIRQIIHNDREIMGTFKEQDNLVVSMYTQDKKMTNMDKIHMSPTLPQIILLPPSATVTSAYAFPNTIEATYQNNRIDLISTPSLDKSTVNITYLEGNSIKIFSLMVAKPDNMKKTFIYPMIEYTYSHILPPLAVVERYNEVHHKDPSHGSMIKINNTVYIFYKDKVNGYLNFGKGLYRLEIQNINSK